MFAYFILFFFTLILCFSEMEHRFVYLFYSEIRFFTLQKQKKVIMRTATTKYNITVYLKGKNQ